MSVLSVRSTERPLAEINITPLIDVMLALLLIFMISAPLLTQRIPLPMAGIDGAAPRSVELQLTADGQVLHNDVSISAIELEAQLLNWAGEGERKPMLQLRPDKATTHQRVIDLLSLARHSGLDSIAIQTPR